MSTIDSPTVETLSTMRTHAPGLVRTLMSLFDWSGSRRTVVLRRRTRSRVSVGAHRRGMSLGVARGGGMIAVIRIVTTTTMRRGAIAVGAQIGSRAFCLLRLMSRGAVLFRRLRVVAGLGWTYDEFSFVLA